MCQPAELGGRGQPWGDAIRMGPEQLLFLLTDHETAKREARYRLMVARGMTPAESVQEARDRMTALRKAMTGRDQLDEVEF